MPISIKPLILSFTTMALVTLSANAGNEVFYTISQDDFQSLNKATFDCGMAYLRAVEMQTGSAVLKQIDLNPDLSGNKNYLPQFEQVTVLSSNASPALTETFGKDKLLFPGSHRNEYGFFRYPTIDDLQKPLDVASYTYSVFNEKGEQFTIDPPGNNWKLSKDAPRDGKYKVSSPSPRTYSRRFIYDAFDQCGITPKFASMLRTGALEACRKLNNLSKEVKIRSTYSEVKSDRSIPSEEMVSPALDKCLADADRALAAEAPLQSAPPSH